MCTCVLHQLTGVTACPYSISHNSSAVSLVSRCRRSQRTTLSPSRGCPVGDLALHMRPAPVLLDQHLVVLLCNISFRLHQRLAVLVKEALELCLPILCCPANKPAAIRRWPRSSKGRELELYLSCIPTHFWHLSAVPILRQGRSLSTHLPCCSSC